MTSFTDRLTLTEGNLAEWRKWTLEQPLVYQASSFTITVPAGFMTDGASVPRPLWWLMPAWGRHSRAAVLHDYLCALLNSGMPHPMAPKRSKADAIFYDAMKLCGVNTTVRFLMWLSVRAYAIATWKK